MKISYPQFRKYPNNKAYFKIFSEKEWEEKQVLAGKVSLHKFNVTIFPDRNFLYDMTFDYQKHWVKIDEEEYNSI